jgi:hypothetical protein
MAGVLTTKPLIFYYKNVKLPNLDLKQGISYMEREGDGWGGGESERETDIDRNRERESKI